MDILVTTPKTVHELAAKEADFVAKNPDAYWFRTIRGKPNITVGERVYYVDKGQITGYGVIFDIECGEMQCEATGKIYQGTHLKQRKWVPLQTPVPFAGFQGFRYIDRIPDLREKLSEAEDSVKICCGDTAQQSYYSGSEITNPKSKYGKNPEKECSRAPLPCVKCHDAYISHTYTLKRNIREWKTADAEVET